VTNYLHHRTRTKPEGSRGTVVVYVLLFLVGSAIILAAVITLQKTHVRHDAGTPGGLAVVSVDDPDEQGYDESYWRDQRGLKPNRPDAKSPEPEPTPAKPEYQFVGDTRYRRYHLPDCRHVGYIEPDKRVLCASAEEAFAKGLVPCKVCNPPVPETRSVAETPRTQPKPGPGPAPGPGPKPRPPTRTEPPVALPVKDVDVPFEYWVISNNPDTYKGVTQVDLVVEVKRPLQKDNILLLAQKLVAAETRKQNINAVSIFLRTRVDRTSSIKWVCMVEWAPYGNLTRANEVKPGDYKTHKFSIYQQGFFNP